MIITIVVSDENPERTQVSVATDLDTWVGYDMDLFHTVAAVTSALTGQHPVFLSPAMPVEALVDDDPEADTVDLYGPDDFKAPQP